MPNYDYKKDLQVARVTEKEMADFLVKLYGFTFMDFCHTNAWDLMMRGKDGKIYTFEIKEDFVHARTGNIGLEFECRGKPSGIAVSQADFYIYKIHNRDKTTSIYAIRAKSLRRMIKNKAYFRIVSGGDKGSNSKNYLFKDTVFYSNAKKIGN